MTDADVAALAGVTGGLLATAERDLAVRLRQHRPTTRTSNERPTGWAGTTLRHTSIRRDITTTSRQRCRRSPKKLTERLHCALMATVLDRRALFATPVCVFELADAPPNAELASRLAEERQRSTGIVRSNVGGWHSTPELAQREEPCFRELFQTIVDRVSVVVGMLAEELGARRRPAPTPSSARASSSSSASSRRSSPR